LNAGFSWSGNVDRADHWWPVRDCHALFAVTAYCADERHPVATPCVWMLVILQALYVLSITERTVFADIKPNEPNSMRTQDENL
jgi:hypothetical protein